MLILAVDQTPRRIHDLGFITPPSPGDYTAGEGQFYRVDNHGNSALVWVSVAQGVVATSWGGDPSWYIFTPADYANEDAIIVAALAGELPPL